MSAKRPLRLYYDGYIYGCYDRGTGGITRYFDSLISHLPTDLQILLTSSRPPQLPHPHHPGLQIVHANPRRWPVRLSRKLEHFKYTLAATLFEPDLNHPTYYIPPRIFQNQRRSRPLVYTIYDMIHEIFSEQEDPQGEAAGEKKACLEQADLLLCISDSTRQDLLRFYPQLESRSCVVPLASSLDCAGNDCGSEHPNPTLPNALATIPYVLYVGNRNTYKNFPLLLKAVAALQPSHSDLHLCIAGQRLNGAEWRQVAELGLGQRLVQVESPADDLLKSLYACALLFVYPSLYEGFGIPPLEAMQCGTAVVASHSSSIPEVVGDAASLFDPTSLEDLVESMRTLLDSASLREQLISKGHQRVKQFSWSRTAAQTMEHYRSLL
ncbi:glycosyltransferase family 4 protein [Synechococcus sp. CS-1324]|uniref:glycosyltransferase family 4 protein n=1 Tax=Synechococcus sp. CS-1324 TaxID=2847980 RepID=UPI000DB8795B|nr:glycosyltransferase family 1 protein [Synechococcus sp. CS-1324]MCT0229480.1 glycosyltransferase family 4 protein [Synechococcus sp. CS-1324]PZV04864.1 MAG: glycosyltransferase family 1 protein [Cyanobium sp.]